METYTCLLLSTIPKCIYSNMEPIYTNVNTGVVVIFMQKFIYMHKSIPPSFPPSLGSYKVDFVCLFPIKF